MHPPLRFSAITLACFSPILALMILFETVYWRVGETLPASVVARRIAAHEKIVFMRQYFDQSLYRFKYLTLQELKPQVISLGTSRVMQFRSEMFAKGVSFFNGGGLIQHLRDLEEYSIDLPTDSNLKLVILGVEFWWFIDSFSEQAEKQKHFDIEVQKDDVFNGVAHANLFQTFIRDLIGLSKSGDQPDFKSFISSLNESDSAGATSRYLGWYAKRKRAGFRSDGSFDYGESFSVSAKFYDREKVLDRLSNNDWKATRGIGISEQKVLRLVDSLERIKKKGVQIVLFLPPFPSEVLRQLSSSKEYSTLWREYVTVLPEILRQKSFSVINATSTRDFGFDDSCMIDGLHALETFHVALLNILANQRGSVLNRFVNTEYLIDILSRKDTNAWFPSYSI